MQIEQLPPLLRTYTKAILKCLHSDHKPSPVGFGLSHDDLWLVALNQEDFKRNAFTTLHTQLEVFVKGMGAEVIGVTARGPQSLGCDHVHIVTALDRTYHYGIILSKDISEIRRSTHDVYHRAQQMLPPELTALDLGGLAKRVFG